MKKRGSGLTTSLLVAIVGVAIAIVSIFLFYTFSSDIFDTFGNDVGSDVDPTLALGPRCSDSDGGQKLFTFGEVCLYDNNLEDCLGDVCLDGAVLKEYSCEDGKRVSVEEICGFGCFGGVCAMASMGTSFSDDYEVDILDNENVNPGSIDHVSWDGSTNYFPIDGARIRNDDPGLIALWHLDHDPLEGQDTECNPFDDPLIGFVEDSSGNGNHGSCFFDLFFCEGVCPFINIENHKVGLGAYRFLGGGYSSFDAGTFDVVGEEMTTTGWIRLDSSPDEGRVIISKSQGADYYWGFEIEEIIYNNGTANFIKQVFTYSLRTDDPDFNRHPILEQIGHKEVNEQELLEFVLNFSDPDGDSVVCEAFDLPPGASFDSVTCTFTWTPSKGSTGNYLMNFSITDNGIPSKGDSEEIYISVGAVDNHPPELDPINDRRVHEGKGITIDFYFDWNDPDGDSIACSASNLPEGASFNDNFACRFFWSPDFDDAGEYTVVFNISDDHFPSLGDREEVTILVDEAIRGANNSDSWIEPGDWIHVAAVYDGGNIVLYKNGTDIGSIEKRGPIVTNDEASVDVLFNPFSSSVLMDELAVWGRALNEIEIVSLSEVESGESGIVNSFTSNLINTGADYYGLNVSWVESGSGTNIQLSTDEGINWCYVNNGGNLSDESCPFPGTTVLYRVIYTDDTNLDNILIQWDSVSECSDGMDNDGDGATDWQEDFSCLGDPGNDNEGLPEADCQDGDDNDNDGWIDAADPGCHTDGDANNPDSYDNQDNSEENNGGECFDSEDNDGDGLIDGFDPTCIETQGVTEFAECVDGIDNDEDGFTDYLEDPDCSDLNDNNELSEGDFDITTCGELSVPGTYYLQNNIVTDEMCFNITSDRIVLDGNDYTITGDHNDPEDFGVFVANQEHVGVRDLEIVDFGGSSAINVGGAVSFLLVNHSSIIRTIVRSSKDSGIHLAGSSHNVIQENVVSEHLGNFYGNGFFVRTYCEDNCIVSKNNHFIDNIATENIEGFSISGSFNVLRDNTAETNARGFRITGDFNKITNNLASFNTAGIFIGGHYNEVRNNVATLHFENSGISIGGDYNLIINNSMSLNLYGIGMGSSDNNYVVNNTILQSLSTGIYISYGTFGGNSNNTIEGNNISESLTSGISVQVSAPGEPQTDHRNIFRGNHISQSPPQEGIEGGQGDGIRLDESDENLIEDNIFEDNADSIILFESSDNVIQNNLIDSSFDSGININSDSNRNFILGNTLSNNFQSGLRIFFSSDTEVVGTVINNTMNNAIVVEGDSANNEIRNVVITNTNDKSGKDIMLATPTITNMRLVNTSFGSYFFQGSGDSGSTVEFVTNDGKIKFVEPINGQGANLSNDVRVLMNLASVDSVNKPGLNKSADITLYGLPDFENPIILRDGVPCEPEICSLDSFENGVAVFSVESWTNYSIDEGADSCPADFDDSGDVGVKDLLILLGSWGLCPDPENCPADLDGSGDVGVKDLLILLGSWGLCPEGLNGGGYIFGEAGIHPDAEEIIRREFGDAFFEQIKREYQKKYGSGASVPSDIEDGSEEETDLKVGLSPGVDETLFERIIRKIKEIMGFSLFN